MSLYDLLFGGSFPLARDCKYYVYVSRPQYDLQESVDKKQPKQKPYLLLYHHVQELHLVYIRQRHLSYQPKHGQLHLSNPVLVSLC